ncbi:MAG: trypsin-like serine protease [Deltaproteobacteria bacterium]|nr:trypsin-like serine protease [Deltaproteobacteria bacterium]
MNRPAWLLCAILFGAVLGGASGNGCEAIETVPLDLSSLDNDRPGFHGIVGGEATGYTQWKGVVALSLGQGGLCSGTLIDPEVVLSAGHCVYLPSENIDEISNPAQVRILGGADLMAGPINVAGVTEIVKHPTWNGNLNGGTDLSLLHLDTKVTSVEHYPIRLTPSPAVGTKGKIVGYGTIAYNDQNNAGIHRMGDTTCLVVQPDLIEVGDPASTCQGDSGGPLFTEQNGQWAVTGVTSYGTSAYCDAMKDGWDVNVTAYRDWINEVVTQWTGHGIDEGDTDTAGTDTGTGSDTGDDTSVDSDTGTETDGLSGNDADDLSSPDAIGDSGCGCREAGRLAPTPFLGFLLAALP